ncbi:hypothetical protein SH668x_000739 [Planctomicrobium sp. SH668]|uniref:hypothetical protein n=1 Tax=Planctomicrobium sp. SH668 TaxID=3448126 RepID=UPI003F5BC322
MHSDPANIPQSAVSELDFSRARKRPSPLCTAVAIAAGWILALAVLTWFTSNPVTLNFHQIIDSKYVVVGKVIEEKHDGVSRLLVEPVDGARWTIESREPIVVRNLKETRVVVGETYLFPLSQVEDPGIPMHGNYYVTPSLLPNGEPLVYPASEESLKQLDEILAQPRSEVPSEPIAPAPRD